MATPAPRDQRDDAEILAAITRECERLGVALQITDAPGVDLAEIKVIDGHRTLVVPPSDDLAETLDDFLLIGRCIDCRSKLDDTALLYADGYNHIDGTPMRICRACLDARTVEANDPNRLAFSRCMDAIEAVFKASQNKQMTQGALRELVDMCAAKASTASPGLLTEAQRTLTLDEGLGAHRTTAIETALRDLDSDAAWGRTVSVPWLAAEIVVHDDKPQAYGRTTKLWLHYGIRTGELSPAQAREALDAMRGFLPRLEALVALAEETAAGDFVGDPEIARLDREADDRRIKAINEGRA